MKWIKRGPVRALSLLILLLCLVGCKGEHESIWKEQVLLHDGRMVVVDRRATMSAMTPPGAGRGGLRRNEIAYSQAGARWGMFPKSARQWIVSFEIFDEIPYLVLVPSYGKCAEKGPLGYDAEILKWSSGKWVEVTQQDFSASQATLNMSIKYWGNTPERDVSGLLSWKEKVSQEHVQIGGNPDGPEKPQRMNDWFEQSGRLCGKTHPELFKRN